MNKNILDLIRQAFRLSDLVHFQEGSLLRRAILKKTTVTFTLFASARTLRLGARTEAGKAEHFSTNPAIPTEELGLDASHPDIDKTKGE